jgi:hypothetical protein
VAYFNGFINMMSGTCVWPYLMLCLGTSHGRHATRIHSQFLYLCVFNCSKRYNKAVNCKIMHCRS